VTVTLPSPARMLVALVLIAAVFVAALRYGHSHRPPAHSAAGPPGPVLVQQGAAATPAPSVTAPPAAPSLPTLAAFGPGAVPARTVRR
jgi:hypothetical protein